MSTQAFSGRGSAGDLVLPYVFIPHGEPIPADVLARFSHPIIIPATFKRTTASDDGTHGPNHLPESGAGFPPPHPADALEGFEADPSADTGFHRAAPIPPAWSGPNDADALATYLRVNAYLDSVIPPQAGVRRAGTAEERAASVADGPQASVGELTMVADYVVPAPHHLPCRGPY